MAKEVLSPVEKELRDITKLKPKKKEERQDFLSRLLDGVDALGDDKWDDLSDEAQKWANAATKAASKKKPLPEFPSADSDDDEPEAEEEDEKPKAKKAAGRSKTSGESEAPAKAKRGKSKSADSDDDERPARDMKVRLKMFLIENPDMSVPELEEAFTKQDGPSPSRSTIAGIRSEFRHSLRVLKQAGKLKGVSI